MNRKTYSTVTAVIFLVIALVHVSRAVMGWELSVGGWMAPMWASWVGLLIAGFLSYSGFKLSNES